ncbi:poly(ADP-ribose) glycohydrolase 1 [Elaeis guineensis]|uniref:poly(ADP-ribose) glycohydrolase n=1 Tax=Elaeis guineensis var. tenera TaxID=51953 RepID=A0A6I9QF39_ELAGV|nr:poly(ADP-ribose) glycohydrolase 1 [Elaeis guineensis]
MEQREDLNSILPFLPLILRSSSLFWPSKALESLKALALGPDVSHVDSGEVLFDAILDLRDSIGLSSERLASRTADGYALFFDELMSRVDSRVWFGEVIPGLARLLLRLPSLLETHYRNADEVFGGRKAGLRIMAQQEAGIVFLSQELIAALLACALFCLFATSERSVRYLPLINFDRLFAALHSHAKRSQEQKIKCIVHYFERICLCMPMGSVSFERKVLPLKQSCDGISYPEAAFWRKSTVSLCPFEVFSSGLIEDQQYEALEVDFANEFLGGGALGRGCVQEEIRFMVNPELIVGMLFMASMGCNEAIEIVGAERFSCYAGYGSSFCFVGDYLDKKPCDSMGRRKTRIVAIDAVCSPGIMQYEVDCLVRETNKAFCGFLDASKYQHCSKIFQDADENNNEVSTANCNIFLVCEANAKQAKDPDNSENKGASNLDLIGKTENKSCQVIDSQVDIGIATGNWGCGAFGGDPEIKSMIQWLAASQALRPFIHYYTFGEAALQRLEQVTQWTLVHGWTVGDLWSMVVEYSFQRLRGETNAGFLTWLLPDHSTSNDVQCMSE